MNKTIELSPDARLPMELTTRRTGVFGLSGSGKSNTAVVCIEHLLAAGEQVVLVDPKGEGWGLQTSADGKRAGHDVIVFGQPRGDVPELREEHAQQIADFVVDSGRSVVLSLLGFDSDQAERRFVTNFCQRLYRRKSQQTPKTRTLVVLEEAHLFVPERAEGKVAEMVGAVKRIARQGRSAGMGLMLVDQRPQDVAKSVITQCELLVCHQLVHKLDREALRDWIRAYDSEGQGERFLDSLASLQPGQAWVWSPAWLSLFTRTQVARRKTYDSGATPDGSPASAPKAKARVDLDALRTHLAKVVDEVKANDPVELRRQLADRAKQVTALERKLADRPAAAPKTVEKPVLRDGQLARVEKMVEDLGGMLDAVVTAVAKVSASPLTLPSPPARRPEPPAAPPIVARTVKQDVDGHPNGDGQPNAYQLSLVNAAVRLVTLGVVDPSKRHVAALAGKSPRSSEFDKSLAKLRALGLVDYTTSGGVVPTAAGSRLASADARRAPEGPDELVNAFRSHVLDGYEVALFDVLVEHRGHSITREQLSAASGKSMKSSQFDNALASMRGLKIVEYGADRTVKVSDGLFLGA